MQDPASFAEAERQLKAGVHLTGEQLAALLELNPKTALPDLLRTYIIGALRGRPWLPTGRKARVGARWDFTMADVIALYDENLLVCRAEDKAERKRARAAGETLPRAGVPAHERAATAVLDFEPSLKRQIVDIEKSRPETVARKCAFAAQEREVFGSRDPLAPV